MTLFLSDTHLGSPLCQADRLSRLIHRYRVSHRDRTLYLVGDLFDDVTPRYWPQEHVEVIEQMLDFQEIIYLPGNHDASMQAVSGLSHPNITVCDESFYHSHAGKRYFLTHGDKYDWTMAFNLPVSVRRLIKPQRTNGIHGLWFGKSIQKRIVAAAKELGCDGAICGHTHLPLHETVDGVEYVNCGDWMINCTAVVDDEHGMRIVGGNRDDVSQGAARCSSGLFQAGIRPATT